MSHGAGELIFGCCHSLEICVVSVCHRYGSCYVHFTLCLSKLKKISSIELDNSDIYLQHLEAQLGVKHYMKTVFLKFSNTKL